MCVSWRYLILTYGTGSLRMGMGEENISATFPGTSDVANCVFHKVNAKDIVM